MTTFNFSISLEVRYSDLDAQGHLNHARYLSFMEQARLKYIIAAGLWADVHDFNAVGQIVAEATCSYKRPVLLGQMVEVAVCVLRLGNKSMDMEYRMLVDGVEVATGRTVQVAYDYAAGRSILIPDEWRVKISAFEKL
ncbi:MAG: acyl-CoA thioesterase [Chloroflexi bacterium]|nr:acyl-CoA thioesterase [Chloroflexota bacterium]